MNSLESYARKERIYHQANAGLHGLTAAFTGYGLMRAQAVPALAKMAGGTAIMAGAVTLAAPDSVTSSKMGGLMQVAGGVGLLTLTAPAWRSRAAIAVAAGSMVGLVDHLSHNNPANWYKATVKGVVLGGAVGLGVALSMKSAPLAIATGVAGMVIGGLAGKGTDEAKHTGINLPHRNGWSLTIPEW